MRKYHSHCAKEGGLLHIDANATVVDEIEHFFFVLYAWVWEPHIKPTAYHILRPWGTEAGEFEFPFTQIAGISVVSLLFLPSSLSAIHDSFFLTGMPSPGDSNAVAAPSPLH